MDQIRFEKLKPEDVICRYKWDYPIVNLMSAHTRQCCRTPKLELTEAIINDLGTDAISNTPYQKLRRLEKLTGFTHSDCSSCIMLERNGVRPPRTGKEEFVDYLKKSGQLSAKTDAKEFELSTLTKDIDLNSKYLRADHPQMLEIVLGNQCDLKCTYCNAHYSTKWADELITHGEMNRAEYNSEFPKAPANLDKVFWQWFSETAIPSVEFINILGGEPLIVNRFYQVLEKMIEAYRVHNRKIFQKKMRPEFGLITNFNASEANMTRFLSYVPSLAKTFKLHIQPSMESLGGRAEYIRYGIKWERFVGNVERTLGLLSELRREGHDVAFSFQMALNTLSISSLPEFLEWVIATSEKYDFPIGLAQNVISFPAHHNPMILPREFEHYFHKSIEILDKHGFAWDAEMKAMGLFYTWENYKHFLIGLMTGLISPVRDYSEDRKKFAAFIAKNDFRRGTDFASTFPEMRNFFNSCRLTMPAATSRDASHNI